ncbi:MAG: hypothetical protein KUL85_16625 [Sphingobacterium mizutaii]|nr:hypothetical protein [Sphingobacterium mizutaii]
MSNVPKIIHQIVGPGVNEFILRCLNSWKVLEKHGFAIERWDDSKIADFLYKFHRFSYDAFINARNHAEAGDIARYLIIHEYGGFYVDWDIELIDIEAFFSLNDNYRNGFMLIDPSNGTLASEFFCCIKSDPFLMGLSKDIAELYENGDREKFLTPQFSGPYRMRDSFAKYPNTYMNPIPVKDAFAYDYSEIRNPPEGEITQAMIHYWLHSWVSKN